MLETARGAKGEAFGGVLFAAVQARCGMTMYDTVNPGANAMQRLATAKRLMDGVRQLATGLELPPDQLAEAMKHARVVYREAFER